MTFDELVEKYVYQSGPIVVGPAEWYAIMRLCEATVGDDFRLSDNSWPILLGRECRCEA